MSENCQKINAHEIRITVVVQEKPRHSIVVAGASLRRLVVNIVNEKGEVNDEKGREIAESSNPM